VILLVRLPAADEGKPLFVVADGKAF
jgi:hypothetical protein